MKSFGLVDNVLDGSVNNANVILFGDLRGLETLYIDADCHVHVAGMTSGLTKLFVRARSLAINGTLVPVQPWTPPHKQWVAQPQCFPSPNIQVHPTIPTMFYYPVPQHPCHPCPIQPPPQQHHHHHPCPIQPPRPSPPPPPPPSATSVSGDSD